MKSLTAPKATETLWPLTTRFFAPAQVHLFAVLAVLLWSCQVRAASFSDGFEAYNQDYLDKNLPGGANATPNGSGNPWWGPNPPNFAVVPSENGVAPHSGSQMLRNEVGSLFQALWFDNDFAYYNLAFRENLGALFYGNFVLEWWFYDPCGDAAVDPLNRDYYGDFVALANYSSGLPSNADYTGSGAQPSGPVQQMALGAIYLWGAADTSKYQAQVLGATDGLPSIYPAWFNTATTRSVGWHQARIVFGPADPATQVATVNFYLDDMLNPTLSHDNAGGVGINCLQLNSMQNSGAPGPVGGYFDDFFFQDAVVAPAIAVGLTNAVASAGDTVTLAANGITGSPTPVLSWQKDGLALANGGNITGADTAALTIAGVTPANLGAYSLLASNVAGAALSTALLSLPVPPTIDSQSPTGGIALASLGGAIAFSVTAHASHPISYQWSKNTSPLSDGGNLSGAAAPVLTLTNLAPTDAGDYACHLTNADGATDTATVTLELPLVPVILSPPASLTIGAGTNATFNVAAVGPALVYRWSKGAAPLSDGGRISGAASASLTIAGAADADAGAYSCLITNANGFTNSAPATLAVVDPPLITIQPQPAFQVTWPGSNLVFQVAAQGTQPLAYQWFYSGVPLADGPNLSGAASPSLSLQVASTEDEGTYQCRVSNFANVALSAPAILRVSQTEVTFFDDFESYSTCCLAGGPGLTGRRGGGPLDGQGPWWGWNSPNICVFTEQNGVTPHTGLQMIGGPFNGAISTGDNDRTYLNLSYRFNDGALYLGNILLDWYFCDLFPANNDSYSDQLSLANYGAHMPPDADQDFSKPGNLLQRLAIGGWPGGNLTCYQCAVMTATDGLLGNNGELGGICKYFNTTAPRTNGWHHARIAVGPTDPATRIATCYFFIDDLLNPVLVHDNAGALGFNSIDIASEVIYSGGNNQAAAGYFDDLTFGAFNDPVVLEQPVSQSVAYAGQATFAIFAFGSAFQWQKDGADLPGATNMQLTLGPVGAKDAGTYTCVVSGPRPAVTSDPAVLTVGPAPTLAAALVGKNVVITWTGPWTLQSAPSAAGQYLDAPGAASPFTNRVSTAPARFFRLRN